MTWRDKVVVKILLIVAWMVCDREDTKREIVTLNNHIQHGDK